MQMVVISNTDIIFVYNKPKKTLPSWLELLNTPTTSLQRGMTPTAKCPVYDTKQSDGEVPVMLGLWGM